MLATFCLRLALGMLAALLLLSPKQMHPRFFRTHFLTALGLCVVALITGWSYFQMPSALAIDAIPNYDPPPSTSLGPSTEQRILLVSAVIFTFLGAITWVFEFAPGGRVIQVLSMLSMFATLIYFQWTGRPDYTIMGRQAYQVGAVSNVYQTCNDLTAAALLGAAMTAMLVGHSYLISPGLTIQPLMRQLAALGIALVLRVGVAGTALWFWSEHHDITNLNDETVLYLPVRWLIGLGGPLVFGWLAYRTAKIRSTQSATGILYVVVILTFLGELTSLLLMRSTGLPL